MLSPMVSQNKLRNGSGGLSKANTAQTQDQFSPGIGVEPAPDRQVPVEQILEISRRMTEIQDPDLLLTYVIDRVIGLVGAERGYIVLTQPKNRIEVGFNHSGQHKTDGKKQHQLIKKVLDEVIRSGQPLILENSQSEARLNGTHHQTNLAEWLVMCVPLQIRKDTIGAIYVENDTANRPFARKDLLVLRLFAGQAALAIENAALEYELNVRVAARLRELEQTWSEAVEANRIQTDWLNNMAHDLRAPLAIATTALLVLQEGTLGNLNEVQLEWVGKSLTAVQHSTNLINDLAYLFKLEAGGIALKQEEVSLRPFLQAIYDIGLGLPWAKNVNFERDLPANLPTISLEPVRIRQVLLNLLTNAQKFTSCGQVMLYARALEHEVIIGVKDSGEGIAADKLSKLFQRFHQADDNQERRQQGSGLGLAICQELVEMHGGRIWVESTPGQGSNFRFTLPMGGSTTT